MSLEHPMTFIPLKLWCAIMHDERGVTLVEYAIALSVGVLLGIGAMTLLVGEINAALGAASSEMPN
jgi:pilus assembly protein Flp/PilA